MDNTSSKYLYVTLNWDANRFLLVESKACMNSASYEYKNLSARTGAQVVPLENADYLLENLSCEVHENIVN